MPPPSPSSPPLMPPGYLQIAGGYYMIESGSCGVPGVGPGSWSTESVRTTSECEAAATALGLPDKTAWDGIWHAHPNLPPGCLFTSFGDLYVLGSASSGSCSSDNPCICKATPPNMPPGYYMIAGDYYLTERVSCGDNLIRTTSECSAAATALDLPATNAYDATSQTTNHPPGCNFNTASVYLYVDGDGSTGACSSTKQCICKSTPP
eukprot:scaffold2458_cov61-Phaeocystis_antarctica.AAC.1